MSDKQQQSSYQVFRTVGLAVDPIHVGTGGARLGRVDNTIVRDPVTRVPKIPGSSLAGVHRAYAAMAYEDARDESKRNTPHYPNCAGQGQREDTSAQGQTTEHCGQRECPVCAVFGRASFAGLAAFSDAQVLLFPVASREGPVWVTSPGSLETVGAKATVNEATQNKAQRGGKKGPINLGWLQLDVELWSGLENVQKALKGFGLQENLFAKLTIVERLVLVSDKLFSHIVNSSLEVRTSVAINPATGAAEEGFLFTYEAIPRGAVLAWDLTCRDPRHFKEGRSQAVTTPELVRDVVTKAHPLLGALGIGGMGTRGMGRLEVLTEAMVGAK